MTWASKTLDCCEGVAHETALGRYWTRQLPRRQGRLQRGRSWARPDGTGGNRVHKDLGLGRSSYLPTAAA
jgi:hypothetical protein